MTARKIQVIHATDRAKVVFGAGDEYRYLATGASTAGAYFLVEAIVPPGGGPPAHIQTREEEAFYILEGELTFYGDDGEITAGPGTYLNIPVGAKHRFRNNSNRTAKMSSGLTSSRSLVRKPRRGSRAGPSPEACSLLVGPARSLRVDCFWRLSE